MEQSFQKFDFAKYKSILLRRKWWGIIPFVILIIATAIVAVSWERTYPARYDLFIGSTFAEENIDPYLARMRRERMAEEKVETLRTEMININSVRRAAERVPGAAEGFDLNQPMELDRFFSRVQRNLRIAPTGTNYVAIHYSGKTPTIAGRFVHELVNGFINERQERVKREYEGILNRRNEEVDDILRRLNDADTALRTFRERHARQLLIRDADYIAKNLEQTQIRISEIQAEIEARRRKSAFLSERLQETSQNRETSATYRRSVKRMRLDEAIAELEISVLLMHDQYTEDHPRVRRIQTQIELLKGERDREEDEKTDVTVEPNPTYDKLREDKINVDLDLQMLESEQIVKRELDERLRNDLRNVPEVLEQESKRRREIDALTNYYNQAVVARAQAEQRYDLARNDEINAFKHVSLHVSPSADTSRMLRIAVFGAFLSLGAAIAAVMGAEFLDQSFTSVDEARDFLRIPSLGIVPVITTKKDVRRRRVRLMVILATIALLLAALVAAAVYVDAVREIVTNGYRWFSGRLEGLI